MKRYQSRYTPYSTRRSERKLKRNLIITLLVTAILIYFLIVWFVPTLVGGLSFLNRFKDQPANTKSISEMNILAPPVFNIPYEATNTSAVSLKGYSTPLIKVEIYLDDELVTTVDIKEDGSFSSEEITLNLGNNNIYGKAVNDKDEKSLPSKTFRLLYDNEKPKLELSQPLDNQEIKGGERKINVSGSTEPDAIVEINSIRVIVTSEGKFSGTLELNDGDNIIVVKSSDKAGNSSEVSRRIVYQPS